MQEPSPSFRSQTPAERGAGSTDFALSIVLVVRDAAVRLPFLLDELAGDLSQRKFKSEVIVVDDGSKDGTAQAAAAQERLFHGLQVLQHGTRRGAGEAVRTGVKVARGEFVFVVDEGDEVPLGVLDEMLTSLRCGADIVLASPRFVGDGRFDTMFDSLSNTTFRMLARWLLPIQTKDVDAAFRGFRRASVRRIAQRSRIKDGRAARVEWLALAQGLRMQVVEISSRRAKVLGRRGRGRTSDLASVRELLRIRSNLSSRKYAKPRKDGTALFDTSFVKLSQAQLAEARAQRQAGR